MGKIKLEYKETKYPLGKQIFEAMESWLECSKGVPAYKLSYARDIVYPCRDFGFEVPIKKEVMYKALEQANKENKRVLVVPDDQFLSGGYCEKQCDGWSYHPTLIEKNVYTEEEDYWAAGGENEELPTRITPSIINSLIHKEIFVFGSNKQGMHMGGAALVAFEKFGAEWGNGEGLQGQSYALPTMEGMDSMTEAVNRFIRFAEENRDYTFFVTPVGCGIAGYTAEEVAPLFKDATELHNVYLPISFWKVLVCMDYKYSLSKEVRNLLKWNK